MQHLTSLFLFYKDYFRIRILKLKFAKFEEYFKKKPETDFENNIIIGCVENL